MNKTSARQGVQIELISIYRLVGRMRDLIGYHGHNIKIWLKQPTGMIPQERFHRII